jgi:hypothetical protein
MLNAKFTASICQALSGEKFHSAFALGVGGFAAAGQATANSARRRSVSRQFLC